MKRSGVIAIAVLLGAALGTILTGLQGYSAFRGALRGVQERRETLGRIDAIAAQSDAVDRWIAALSANRDTGALLAGDDPVLIAADLQSRLGTLTAETGAVITSLQSMAPVTKDGLTIIAVGFDVQGDLGALITLLEGIENYRPMLFVEEIQVRAPQLGNAVFEGEALLQAQIEVFGYSRAGAPDRQE